MTVKEFNEKHSAGAIATETPEGIDIDYYNSKNPEPVIRITKKGFIYFGKVVMDSTMLNDINQLNEQLGATK